MILIRRNDSYRENYTDVKGLANILTRFPLAKITMISAYDLYNFSS